MPQPGPAAAGAPDGGRAHRQLQRGPSYGAINSTTQNTTVTESAQSEHEQRQGGHQVEGSAKAPPSYAEAIKGDNKVQDP